MRYRARDGTGGQNNLSSRLACATTNAAVHGGGIMARSSIPYARGRETALAKRISPALAIIAASVLILSSYSTVHAQAVSDEGYFRFATAAAFNNFLGNGHQCSDPICTAYGTTDGGQVYTADYVAAQLV
jgi:hypothetical protein